MKAIKKAYSLHVDLVIYFLMCLDLNEALFALQVFDATNTTRERREVILSFAKENGYKVSK